MRSIASAVMMAAAVVALACNRGASTSDAANPDVAEESTVGTSGRPSDTVSHGSDGDARHFALQASKRGAAEVELGTLAAQRATRAEVKAFGQMMVREHTRKSEALQQAVALHGVELSKELPDESEELMARLQALTGAEFDREYMQAMVDAHQEMKAMVEGRLNDARRMTTSKSQLELAVDQWTQNALPGVEQHLARARQISAVLKDAVLKDRTNDTR